MSTDPIIGTASLTFPWQTRDPFLVCVHHVDHYPQGNERLGPAASLDGRDMGQDFAGKDGWRMYHGHAVPGFPQHPHRGFETVTFVREGYIDHSDSLGATARFGRGDVQWLTAGRGIVHAEHPRPQTEEQFTLHGLQLWTSLPRALKLSEPRYQNIDAASIAEVEAEGVRTRVIAGELDGVKGPAATLMPTFLWHVRIEAGSTFEAAIAEGFEAGVYVVDGTAVIGDATRAVTGELAVLAGGEGRLSIRNAGDKALDAMVLGGAPAEGPLVFHGPFVMNSVDQVRAAEIAYRTGRMGHLDD